MVAFVRREAKVYVIGSNGTGLRQLAGVFDDRGVVANGRSSTIQWPSWTPDGKQVRFYASSGTVEGQTGRPGQGLWEVGVDGSDPRLIIPNWHPWYPAWSPDGAMIAWIGDRGTGTGGEDLFVSAPNGVQERRRLTTDPANAEMAAWSPDGEQIAFVNGTRVDVITPNGTGRRTLFECGDSCDGVLWAAWSPDGTKIVFTASVGRRLELRVMNSDGTNVHGIPGVLGTCCPSWQPVATSTPTPG
jgi:Tol biopolymer transport system component